MKTLQREVCGSKYDVTGAVMMPISRSFSLNKLRDMCDRERTELEGMEITHRAASIAQLRAAYSQLALASMQLVGLQSNGSGKYSQAACSQLEIASIARPLVVSWKQQVQLDRLQSVGNSKYSQAACSQLLNGKYSQAACSQLEMASIARPLVVSWKQQEQLGRLQSVGNGKYSQAACIQLEIASIARPLVVSWKWQVQLQAACSQLEIASIARPLVVSRKWQVQLGRLQSVGNSKYSQAA